MDNSKVRWKGRWYLNVYKDLMHGTRLTMMEKAMYVVLLGFVSEASPKPFPSQPHLCKITGLCLNTVQKLLRSLNKKGLLDKEQLRVPGQGDFGSNLYTLYDQFPEDRVAEVAIRNTAPQNMVPHEMVPHTMVPHKMVYKGDPSLKGRSASLPPRGKRKANTNTAVGGDRPSASAAPRAGVSSSVPISSDPEVVPNPESHGNGKLTEEAKQAASQFMKSWPKLVAKIRGHKIVLTPDRVEEIQTFFLENPTWYPQDVLWVAFQGMLLAQRNPRPENRKAHDPYFYCRQADNTRWFGTDKDGNLKVMQAAKELGYYQDMDPDKISERIDEYLQAKAKPTSTGS